MVAAISGASAVIRPTPLGGDSPDRVVVASGSGGAHQPTSSWAASSAMAAMSASINATAR